MFSICGKDIEALSDPNLRELIGRLCEAELYSQQIGSACVLYGGAQDAPDGGIDVMVNGTFEPKPGSYVPSCQTAFQVKKYKMPPNRIQSEMAPKGTVRPRLEELARAGGAYIIVSGKDNTTQAEYEKRIAEMKKIAASMQFDHTLIIDFYDQGRVANWANQYPAVVAWIKEQNGAAICGWRPYANWSFAVGGIDAPYLEDERVRLIVPSPNETDGSVLDGIHHLRKALSTSERAIRLVGLSGVGKTRLVQALFDKKIGEKALPDTQVIYADLGTSPTPSPLALAEELSGSGKYSIMVVDNCSPELHRELVNVCRQKESKIKVLTIEYDVQGDEPENTAVYQLKPASVALIARLVLHDFENIGKENAERIAMFSGGNARVARAIAETASDGDSLGELTDEQLFERLFFQRQQKDEQLYRTAEVASLLYSFAAEGEELKTLAALSETSELNFYRNIAKMQERQLVQSRGKWRAVLPHAIANHLANKALGRYPLEILRQAFEMPNHARILLSFSKRLSYLSDSTEAKMIMEGWLLDGPLSDLNSYNHTQQIMLEHAAVVNPDFVLNIIEKHLREGGYDRLEELFNNSTLQRILSELAYSVSRFDRCVQIFIIMAKKDNDTLKRLQQLYQIACSGTHAPLSQRLAHVAALLAGAGVDELHIAAELLVSLLKTRPYHGHFYYDNGAQAKDYGRDPGCREDAYQWFETVIDFCIGYIRRGVATDTIKSVIAESIRFLWLDGYEDTVVKAAAEFLESGEWYQGWIAVKNALYFDKERLPPASVQRLEDLTALLTPKSLYERIRLLFGLNSSLAYRRTHCVATLEEASELKERQAYELGVEAARDTNTLTRLGGQLFSNSYGSRASFGKGLFEGTNHPIEIWGVLCAEAAKVKRCNIDILLGFVLAAKVKNPSEMGLLTKNIYESMALRIYYPQIRGAILFDEDCAASICDMLGEKEITVESLSFLRWSDAFWQLPAQHIAQVIHQLSIEENGTILAIEILVIEYENKKMDKCDLIKRLGRELVLATSMQELVNIKYLTTDFMVYCFDGAKNQAQTKLLLERFYHALQDDLYAVQSFAHDAVIALAKMDTALFLDVFIADGREGEDVYNIEQFLNDHYHNYENILFQLGECEIVAWCQINPRKRSEELAKYIQPYKADGEHLSWTEVALYLLKNGNTKAILDRFATNFVPNGWSGSRDVILQAKLQLFDQLEAYPEFLEAGKIARAKYEDVIRQNKVWEMKWEEEERRSAECFEF